MMADRELLKLARRCLWIAYVWNDHNYQEPVHMYARAEAQALGIDTFEAANEWLVKIDEAIAGEPKPPHPYTAEELDRDNPYNAWMQGDTHK